MAYFYDNGKDERQMPFIAETVSDLAKLPTATEEGDKTASIGNSYQKVAFGSSAICVENGGIYILCSNNQWTKFGE